MIAGPTGKAASRSYMAEPLPPLANPCCVPDSSSLACPSETSYFQVTNSCLDPQCAPGHLDIYVGTSQSDVSGAGDGIWSIEWSPMDCAAAQAAYSAAGNQWQGLPTGAAAGRRRLGSWSRRNRKFMLR